jgi:hypothetical protein
MGCLTRASVSTPAFAQYWIKSYQPRCYGKSTTPEGKTRSYKSECDPIRSSIIVGGGIGFEDLGDPRNTSTRTNCISFPARFSLLMHSGSSHHLPCNDISYCPPDAHGIHSGLAARTETSQKRRDYLQIGITDEPATANEM